MKTMKVDNVPQGEIFLYKKEGEELRAWKKLGYAKKHMGHTDGEPNGLIQCAKEDSDARFVWAQAFYSYVGRTKYLYLDTRRHVVA